MRFGFVIFFGIFILIYSLLNYYVGVRIWQFLSKLMPFLNIKIFWGLFWVLVLSYLLGRALRSSKLNWASDWLTWIGSYWLGIMFYSFLIIVIIDLIRLIDKWLGFIPENFKNNPNIVQIIGLIALIAIVSITIYGVWNAKHPRVVHYDIDIPKSAGSLKSLHIAALSDIHLGNIVDEKQIQKASDIINGLKPDIVLFVGDTIDEDINVFKEKNMVNIFGKINSKLGKYAVLGNHEYISGYPDETISYIEKSGIKVLRDNYIKIDNDFYLAGRDDLSSKDFKGIERKKLSEVLKGTDKNLPIILMDHQPYNLNEPQENRVDLQLSGHTHRGQMFPINFITHAIYEDDWGYLKKGDFNLTVSSGYGTWGPPLRLGNRPEILDIVVKFK